MEKQKIELQCLECSKKFNRMLSPISTKEVICPKCKSIDIDLAERSK